MKAVHLKRMNEVMMKKVLFLLFISFYALSAFSKDNPAVPLTPVHQKFLDEVYWIISDYERDAFLSLKNNEDRDRFITAFWENRDPTPGTKENEFKEEHYKRYAYANDHFGRETAMPGWKTDRGHIYILMGKPEFTKRIASSSDSVAMELWHYIGYKGYGIPSSLYLLFFQRDNIPPFRLYSPESDGVRSLFIMRSENQGKSEAELFDMLQRNADPEVAHASLNSIPSESADPDLMAGSGAVNTEVIMAKIQNARNYDVKNRDYVEAIVHDRPSVQVYYSIGNQGIHDGVYWFQAPTGDYYIDYSIEYEPDKLDVGSYNDYYTSLTLDGQIAAPDKTEVDQIAGTHEIKLTPEQFEKVKSLSFQYQGRKPLIPGKYDLTMIISNNVSRKSATFVQSIEIPDLSKQSTPVISPAIFARSIENAPEDSKIRPFQFGKLVITPNLPAKYPQNGTMLVYHQVLFPDTFATTGDLELHYVIKAADKVEADVMEPISVGSSKLAGNYLDIEKAIPLKNLSIGVKTFTVELRNNQKVVAHCPPLTFTVSADAPPAVWKFSSALPGFESGLHHFVLAQQLLRLKRVKEALDLLEDAHAKDPNNVEITYQLMRASMQEKNYDRVIKLGSPIEVNHPRDTQVLWLLGWANFYEEKYQDALRFFERYRIEDAKKVGVLNILAEIYYRLNDNVKSLERVEQSLALNPHQKDILELKKKLQPTGNQ
jgi:GWxTD domain-containing protein